MKQKQINYKIIIIASLTQSTMPLQAWSLITSVNHGYETVRSWLPWSKKNKELKEYPINSPTTLIINNCDGDIIITQGNKSIITIETITNQNDPKPHNNVTIHKKDATLSLTNQAHKQGSQKPPLYLITAPQETSVIIKINKGSITLNSINGSIYAQTLLGTIKIIDTSSNEITAKAPRGSITLIQKNVANDATIFLESYRSIDMIAPANLTTTLHATTLSGTILSDFFITLDPITLQLDRSSWKKIQKNIRGKIEHTNKKSNARILLDSTQGNITLKKG